MKTIFFLKGLPASGKTTWSITYTKAHPSTKRVSKDELRRMFHGNNYSFENEKTILAIRDYCIEKGLVDGFDIIVDDTNFKDKHYYAICDIAKRVGNTQIIEKYFDISLKEALLRNANRVNKVPENIIIKLYETNVKNKHIEIRNVYFQHKGQHLFNTYNPDLRKAIVIDIDGTLAINTSRDYYDLTRVEEDTLNKVCSELIDIYSLVDHKILLVSGRDESARQLTIDWLNSYHIKYDHLLMRSIGDSRSDTIVKKELFDLHIKDKFNVSFAVDDRKKVCRMRREQLNIPVLQLDDVDF
jgi:predicted kinase